MRILHVLKDIRNTGNGVTNVALDMAVVQRQMGHCVAVASAGGEYQDLLQKENVEHYGLHPADRFKFVLRNCLRFRSLIRTFRPEVVHCHLAPGLVLAWFTRLTGQRYSLIAHIHNVQEKRSVLMGLADRVIAVSAAVAESMRTKGIPAHKLFVVCNCVVGSPRRLELSDQIARPLRQPAIVTIAGMNRRKNIDGLISAFDKIGGEFPEAHLYLVGDGCDRELFQKMAAGSSAVSRIHFEGFQVNPKSYFAQAAIFVLPSHRDSFPLVLHEAREAGAALIGTNVDGIAEALDFGEAGILVPVGDTDRLAASLRGLLSNPQELERWRQASRKGLQKHTVSRMVEEILAVYQHFVGDAGAAVPSGTEVSGITSLRS